VSTPPPSRCGFIAIVGAPNAGKSTLMNRLTGAKLSIVSPKAQTTRFRVLGILMRAESQVLLVDTPGIFRPKRKLDRAMVAAAWTGAADADVAMLLVDARSGLREDVRAIAERLGASGRRCWLVLNKTDLVTPPSLLPLIASLGALAHFEETFMVSAQTGDGIRRLADALAAVVPEGPWFVSRSSCKPMRKSRTAPRSKPNPSRIAKTGRFGSRLRSMSPGLATRRS
jgi:GTP-binding protein Era